MGRTRRRHGARRRLPLALPADSAQRTPDGWRGREEGPPGDSTSPLTRGRAELEVPARCRAAHGDASGGGAPAPGWTSNTRAGCGVAGVGVHPARHRPRPSPADRLLRRKPGCDRWRPIAVEGAQAQGHVKPGLMHLRRRPAAAPRWVGKRDGQDMTWPAVDRPGSAESHLAPDGPRERVGGRRCWTTCISLITTGDAGSCAGRRLPGICSRYRGVKTQNSWPSGSAMTTQLTSP
jgi:hypothetical protein